MTLDRDAIETLYRSHGHIVLRRARRLLGSEPDAQEALQEVFAQLLRSPDVLRAARSVVAWLYQATTHCCLNQLRNRRTGARLLEQGLGPTLEASASSNAEALAEVRSLLALMSPDEAAAVVYHHLDGMTHAEVAELLGCSRRQVGYLLLRGQQSVARAEQTL
jgi:RNA polymerase sigma-70 factor (ECF subfamily)